MTEPLLRIRDLRVDVQGAHALAGVDLDVAPGAAVGVVGESGCGKTMTALAVLGLLPPGGRVLGGSMSFAGVDLRTANLESLRGNEIGMVFQDPLTSLNPTMTIGAQVAEPLLLHREVSRREAWRTAEEALGLVGLPQPAERMRSYPHQLSGGMRQRVAIATALVCRPKLLIADEPTTALDVTTQHQILELIDDLRRQLGMALVLVTHDLGVVAERVDEVAVMYAGRVVERARTAELFNHPRHRYTEALLAALPERSARDLRAIPGMPPTLTEELAGCPFAPRCAHTTDQCRDERPALTGDERHAWACFHPAPPVPTTVVTQPVPEPVGEQVLLELDSVSKDFPLATRPLLGRLTGSVSAVAGVSLSIRRGEIFGLVGESGCGKTTVGRLVVGLEQPSSGQIRFDGKDIATLSRAERKPHRRRVQLVFQDSAAAMDPRMRVGAILREPLAIQGIGDRREQRRRVAELLAEVGLPERAVHRYPHEFSGGQRQRLGLARALALRPDLLVADEPVSALDVSVQAQILNLLRRLRAEHALTYLFVSHDLAVVRHLADTVGVMYLGKLVEVGPVREVYREPRHPYTRLLLDSLPSAGAHRSSTAPGGEPPSAARPPSGCRFRTRCPRAEAVCAEVEPPLTTDGGRQVACHFPG
ncbi:ABC transporter ATP-binding protein [Kutzneria albida]|uniref:ABC transporter domain-containing protein n=1 Tax=Kutzneria albida DSM 43870 TaxID=1449976 RepID=W5WMQ1_9PSEU|nr:ABC transporter ATP-binding protein [Kutzneria albida]AHI01817.1 hypothetical protein KALB_8460 [Kutzneria albida DSM 43870]